MTPKRIEAAALEHGWDIESVSRFWTRLRRGDIVIEMSYNLKRETKGRAYRRDIALIAIFHNQRDIIEFMGKPA